MPVACSVQLVLFLVRVLDVKRFPNLMKPFVIGIFFKETVFKKNSMVYFKLYNFG
jgi:hypothetical protein